MSQNTPYGDRLNDARIDVFDGYELRAWADRFGVYTKRLEQAVRAVGDRADAVERYLNRNADGG